MSGYGIGISGMQAAQKALDIIGNNISNSATSGYHRQEIELTPQTESYTSGFYIGQGVEFQGVTRMIDSVLEDEILRQTSIQSELKCELDTLQSIETAFGELSTDGLSTAIDNFFTSFHELSLNPEDVNLQSNVLSTAESLCAQMQNLSLVISNLEDNTFTEAQSIASQINQYASQIAEMNENIYTQDVQGNDTSNTRDQRDALIADLSELISVETKAVNNGMVDVSVANYSLVVGTTAGEVEVDLEADGDYRNLSLSPVGVEDSTTDVSGGELGGLFDLKNEILQEIHSDLDTLAQTIITEVNELHVQGVGQDGSFTRLTGWQMDSGVVTSYDPPVSEGDLYIRVTDSSGTTTREKIAVTSSSTMETIAADIAALTGLSNTTVSNDQLQIIADSGYTFDFLGGVEPTPTTTVPDPLAGAGAAVNEAPPTITLSGLYSGDANQTYTATVNTTPAGTTGQIGNGDMEVVITDGAGVTVATINVGDAYVQGTPVLIDEGVYVSFSTNGVSPGYLNDGEVFTIETLATSDETGFLAAVGINTFFKGNDAATIDLTDEVSDSARRIAVSCGAEMSDNSNAVKIGQVGDSAFAAIGNMEPKEFYRQLAVNVGDQLSLTELQYTNTEEVTRSLFQQRDEISGVDINEQATQMMVYERMFQAMSKYMNTVTNTYDIIMSIIS